MHTHVHTPARENQRRTGVSLAVTQHREQILLVLELKSHLEQNVMFLIRFSLSLDFFHVSVPSNQYCLLER